MYYVLSFRLISHRFAASLFDLLSVMFICSLSTSVQYSSLFLLNIVYSHEVRFRDSHFSTSNLTVLSMDLSSNVKDQEFRGSIFRPTPFLLYINDLLDSAICSFTIYLIYLSLI